MLTTFPTCNALADTLVRLNKKHGDKIELVSIVTLPDTFSETDAFTARHGITWPVVFDSGQVVASYLVVTPMNPRVHFPHLFVIDGTGMIRYDDDSSDDISMTVDGLSPGIDRLLSATKL
jgi:peroxiredoxin